MSTFFIDTRVFFGAERHGDLHRYLEARGHGRGQRVVPVVDGALSGHPAVETILDSFSAAGYELAPPTSYATEGEPTYAELDAFAAPFRDRPPDLFLAIGGGTVNDLVKGTAVLATNPGRGIDYRGMHKVKNPSVPMIAYPSTAGTGTEVTWTASFIDGEEKKKLGINGNHVAPLCGVLEPALVAGCPSEVALSAGLDSMVHAIEAVSARTATAITRALGAKAFALVFGHLPRCLDRPDRLEDWEAVQIGAYLAGMAMMNAGGGPASGISYPLGVHYGVPHGLAGGVFLPHVLAFNVARGYEGYGDVYDLLPAADSGLAPGDKGEAFVRRFEDFYRALDGPRDLSKWECSGEEAVARLTELTVTQRQENLDLNPIPFGRGDVEALLRRVCV